MALGRRDRSGGRLGRLRPASGWAARLGGAIVPRAEFPQSSGTHPLLGANEHHGHTRTNEHTRHTHIHVLHQTPPLKSASQGLAPPFPGGTSPLLPFVCLPPVERRLRSPSASSSCSAVALSLPPPLCPILPTPRATTAQHVSRVHAAPFTRTHPAPVEASQARSSDVPTGRPARSTASGSPSGPETRGAASTAGTVAGRRPGRTG